MSYLFTARFSQKLLSHKRLFLAFTASFCVHALCFVLTHLNYLEHAAATKTYLKATLKPSSGRSSPQTPASSASNQLNVPKKENSVQPLSSAEEKSDVQAIRPEAPLKADVFPPENKMDIDAIYAPEMMFYQSPYLPSDTLTVRPRAITAVGNFENSTTLPIIASGKITLKLWIDQNGTVTTSEIESSNMPIPFSKAAANAFQQVVFSPGEINGQHVGSILRLEINYEDLRLTIQ